MEIISKNTQFCTFCDEQYLPFVKARKRSWKTDVSLIANHLKPFFTGVDIGDIGGPAVLMFQNKKLDQGYQPSSVNRMTVLLKYIVNCSMRWGFRARDSSWTEGIGELKNVRARERFLTQAEAARLIQVLSAEKDRHAASLIQLLLLTGARKSELLFSQWTHIDWNFRTLIVPLSKSGSSRHIYLGHEALKLLGDVRSIAGDQFVFSRQGSDRPITNLTTRWDRIRREAGLQDVRLHDLRHSFASFLVAQGRSLFEVQKLLGHANSKTTMKYAHLDNRHLVAAVDMVGDMVLPIRP